MQQLFITSDGSLKLLKVDRPEVRAKHVLVRTAFSSVSTGTEVSTVRARRSNPGGNPIPLGYSLTGEVEAVGDGIDGISVGDLVCCGGYNISVHAEYVLVPLNFCVKLPSNSDLRKVSFSTIAAISLQAVRLARPALGEVVVVIGTGIIGQFAAALATLSGARTIVIGHRNTMRLDAARALGAELAFLSSQEDAVQRVNDFTDGIGADAVLHCGHIEEPESLEQALNMTREKGALVSVGSMPIEMPRRPLFAKELKFVVSRSTGPGRYDPNYERQGMDYPIAYVRWTGQRNQAECARLIDKGMLNVEPLITHDFPFSSAPDALELATAKGSETLGIVLTY